jgi:hypothetical protein
LIYSIDFSKKKNDNSCNSCRIIIVGVDSVLYDIPGRGDEHRSRCRPKVSSGRDIWRRLRLDGIQVKWEIVEVCLESSRRNLPKISRVLQRSTMVSFSNKKETSCCWWNIPEPSKKSLLDVGGTFRNGLRRKSLLDVWNISEPSRHTMVCLYKEMEGHLQIIPSRNPKEELLQCKKEKRARVGMGQKSEWFFVL